MRSDQLLSHPPPPPFYSLRAQAVLKGGEKISFSVGRPYPYAVFHLPGGANEGAPTGSQQPSSNKRQRTTRSGASQEAAPPISSGNAVASSVPAQPPTTEADLLSAKATLEKQVNKQAKDLKQLREELSAAQQAAATAQAQVRACVLCVCLFCYAAAARLSHPPLSLYTQAAKAEGELAESARKHADELGTRDEQIAQASRLANTELKGAGAHVRGEARRGDGRVPRVGAARRTRG